MTDYVDTKDLESLSGAVYFSVGRGTEGGGASYRLSVAGVTNAQWGQVSEVAANSGYSMGAIQVDFGQRGTWPLGAIEGRALQQNERTYVDAVIEQASAYAAQNKLPFARDTEQLRTDLLTHGNGQRNRSSITFIDSDTRDSINAWASSPEGKSWIHSNIDYPQVRDATHRAMTTLDQYGSNVEDDRRFEAISILAKTANPAPAQLGKLEDVLKAGGTYDDLLAKAREIKANPRHGYYDGPKAAEVAEKYATAYADPTRRESLERAQAKVSSVDFNPSTEASDSDIQAALNVIGQRARAQAVKDPTIKQLQENLNALGVTDARGQQLVADGDRGGPTSRTNQGIAAFQQQYGLEGVQLGNAELLAATQVALRVNQFRNFGQETQTVPLPEVFSPSNASVPGAFAPDPAVAPTVPPITPGFGSGGFAGQQAAPADINSTQPIREQISVVPPPLDIPNTVQSASTTPAASAMPQPANGEQAPAPSQQQAAPPQASTTPTTPDNLRDFRHPDHPRQPGFERFMRSLENAQAGYLQMSNTRLSEYNPEQLERIAAGLTAALGTKPFFREVAEFQLDKEGALWARKLPVNMDEKPLWAKIDLAQTLAQTPEQSAAQWQQTYAPTAATHSAQAQAQTIDPQQLSPNDLRHPDHPRHGMFAHARGLLANEYDRWGLQRDPAQLDRETAQVVVEARQQRMDGVGGIMLTFPPGSTPERPMVALQENPANEFGKRVELKGEQLAQAPQVEQTNTQLQQVEQQVALMQQQEMQQRQEREQTQSQGRTV